MKRARKPGQQDSPWPPAADDDLRTYYQVVDVACLAQHLTLKLRANVTVFDVVTRAATLGLSGGLA